MRATLTPALSLEGRGSEVGRRLEWTLTPALSLEGRGSEVGLSTLRRGSQLTLSPLGRGQGEGRRERC
jgi:hypothetical protein